MRLSEVTFPFDDRGSGVADDCPIMGLGSFGPLVFWERRSASDVWDRSLQGFSRRLANYHKVHCSDKELSA